jgi:hypothetical protein
MAKIFAGTVRRGQDGGVYANAALNFNSGVWFAV